MDTQTTNEAVITHVSEPLHDVAGKRLRNIIRDHVRRGNIDHLVDLRSLAELDSTTLGALIRGLRIAREVGGSVGLIVDQPKFLRVLSITALDRVFKVYRDENAALAQSASRLVPA